MVSSPQATLLFNHSSARMQSFRPSRGPVRVGRHAEGHPHYRRCRLWLTDLRSLLILAVRFGAGRVLRGRLMRLGPGRTSRGGSGCELTGWGCVLRTASASIRSKSALVGEGFVIWPLFLFRLRGFPGQALSLQSFIIFPEGFLLYLVYSVDAARLPAR